WVNRRVLRRKRLGWIGRPGKPREQKWLRPRSPARRAMLASWESLPPKGVQRVWRRSVYAARRRSDNNRLAPRCAPRRSRRSVCAILETHRGGNDMAWKHIVTLATAAVCLRGGGAFAASEYKIVTANEKGTYFAIGADLAKFVAPDAGIKLEVLPTAGSAANIKHLRYDLGVKFAIVQADVFQAFVDRAGGGNAEARTIIRPLRVILPLYN